MNITKEQMDNVEYIRKCIIENKINDFSTIEEVANYILKQCSTPEKQEAFIAGATLGINTLLYDIKKKITNI